MKIKAAKDNSSTPGRNIELPQAGRRRVFIRTFVVTVCAAVMGAFIVLIALPSGLSGPLSRLVQDNGLYAFPTDKPLLYYYSRVPGRLFQRPDLPQLVLE